MLSEQDVADRARYCYCVFLQLGWLYSNDFIEPLQYLDYLKKSSLGLGDDEFIMTTVEEALMQNQDDGGLRLLINLYEGFLMAFCEVLETDLDSIKNRLEPEVLNKLAGEMGLDLKFNP